MRDMSNSDKIEYEYLEDQDIKDDRCPRCLLIVVGCIRSFLRNIHSHKFMEILVSVERILSSIFWKFLDMRS